MQSTVGEISPVVVEAHSQLTASILLLAILLGHDVITDALAVVDL